MPGSIMRCGEDSSVLALVWWPEQEGLNGGGRCSNT